MPCVMSMKMKAFPGLRYARDDVIDAEIGTSIPINDNGDKIGHLRGAE